MVNKIMDRICAGWKSAKTKKRVESQFMSSIFTTHETCIHVLQCPTQSARTQWELAIVELEGKVVTLRKRSSTIKVWKSRLSGWQGTSYFPFSLFGLGERIYIATKEQDSIN